MAYWDDVKIGLALHEPNHVCGRCGHLFAYHFFSAHGAYQGCLGDPVYWDPDAGAWVEAGNWECVDSANPRSSACADGYGFIPSGELRTEFPQPS